MVSPRERSAGPSQPSSPSFDSLDLGPEPVDDTLSARLDRALATLDRWRDRPLVSAVMALGALALLLAAWWLGRPPPAVDDLDIPFTPSATVPVAGSSPNTVGSVASGESEVPTGAAPGEGDPATATAESTTTQPDLVVHVAGAVARPGIVRVEPGARIADAVRAAGGALADADLDRLNLAAPVADGMQVRVPVEGEPTTSPTGIAAPPPAATGGPPGELSGPVGAGPIDLNQADAAALETLHGIGPALAAAIIGWRTDNGPFASVEQLLEVPGIGPATLDGLADDVTI